MVVLLRMSAVFWLCWSLAAAEASGDCRNGECFRGETITIIVGYGAGGGYDAYARMIAPEIEKRTGAGVTVRNRPGGGGLIALNELAEASGDGLTLGLVNITAAVVARGLAMEAVRFDLDRFPWLAGIRPEQRVLVSRPGSARLPWTEPGLERMRWAAGGRTDDMAIAAALLSEAFGLEARIITGYRGTNEAVLGVMRGEADGVIISADSARQYADTREVEALATLADTRSPLFPDTPTIHEASAGVVAGQNWIHLLVSLSELGRGIVPAPDTPEDRVAYLRGVLEEILNDPAFLQHAERSGRRVDYQSPEEVRGSVRSALRAIIDDAESRYVLRDKYR